MCSSEGKAAKRRRLKAAKRRRQKAAKRGQEKGREGWRGVAGIGMERDGEEWRGRTDARAMRI